MRRSIMIKRTQNTDPLRPEGRMNFGTGGVVKT